LSVACLHHPLLFASKFFIDNFFAVGLNALENGCFKKLMLKDWIGVVGMDGISSTVLGRNGREIQGSGNLHFKK
jgi:hypothetical protein